MGEQASWQLLVGALLVVLGGLGSLLNLQLWALRSWVKDLTAKVNELGEGQAAMRQELRDYGRRISNLEEAV